MKVRLILMAAILLSTTAILPANAAIEQVLRPGCSEGIKRNALATITAQNKAIGRQDYKVAFAYSSTDFRVGTSLSQFTQIISQSYSFLGASSNIQVMDCKKMKQAFYVQVAITDRSDDSYLMLYLIQRQTTRELIAPNRTGFAVASAQLTQNESAT